ncbi:MAG: hypothetical protein FWC93_04225 [Defluviitaleaceae bacterium]|nr:hypothetical protein [Defluviitaleaceae bacterium]
MAELPEIAKYSGQMREALRGKTIKAIEVLQEKCTNVPVDELQKRTVGAIVADVYNKGKWIFTVLDNGEHILLSYGMGADVLYFEDEGKLPEKYQAKVLFDDDSGYTARFWWFGQFYLANEAELAAEPKTKDIAIDPFDDRFTLEYFEGLLAGKKTQVKAFLMNQKNVGGIGNMYMHDILFKVGLHPQKKISDMGKDDVKRLYDSILSVLGLSCDKGSFCYEMDFFGETR